jgi:hypothetical protein
MASTQENLKQIYETDYYQWLIETAEQLRSHQFKELDWENLLAEIEDMGKSEKRALRSNLRILLMHLLKLTYQPEKATRSWNLTIVEHRKRIQDTLQESPSLKPYFDEIFETCYQDAIELAVAETGLSPTTFPENCPFPMETVLNH